MIPQNVFAQRLNPQMSLPQQPQPGMPPAQPAQGMPGQPGQPGMAMPMQRPVMAPGVQTPNPTGQPSPMMMNALRARMGR